MTVTRDAVAAVLASSPLNELELRGPGVHLHLRRSGDAIVDVAASADVITAPGVGQFLLRHPLQDSPLASAGTRVVAGQVIALLQVGPLLRPVLAPAAGVAGAPLAAEASLVGYGTALLCFHPDAGEP